MTLKPVRYRWANTPDGVKLLDIGVAADGSIINPPPRLPIRGGVSDLRI